MGGIEAWASPVCQSHLSIKPSEPYANRRNPRPTTCQSHAPAKSEGTLGLSPASTWPLTLRHWSLTHRSTYWALLWSSTGHSGVIGSGHPPVTPLVNGGSLQRSSNGHSTGHPTGHSPGHSTGHSRVTPLVIPWSLNRSLKWSTEGQR